MQEQALVVTSAINFSSSFLCLGSLLYASLSLLNITVQLTKLRVQGPQQGRYQDALNPYLQARYSIATLLLTALSSTKQPSFCGVIPNDNSALSTHSLITSPLQCNNKRSLRHFPSSDLNQITFKVAITTSNMYLQRTLIGSIYPTP